MKIFTIFSSAMTGIVAAACLLGAAPTQAQEEEASETARSILSDPRLQNMLRSVKDDPEAAAKALKDDPEAAAEALGDDSGEAVRAATRLFQEQVAKKRGSGETDVPATRAAAMAEAAERKAKEALAEVSKENSAETAPDGTSGEPAEEEAAQPPPEETLRATPSQPAEETADTSTEESTESAPEEEAPDSPPSPPGDAAPMVVDTPPSLPDDDETVPQIPDSAGTGEAAAPRPLSRSLGTQGQARATKAGKRRKTESNEMEILSKYAVHDGQVITFTGNVFVNYPAFTINCDKLEIHMADGENLVDADGENAEFKKAIASGGMVEVKRTVTEGKGKKRKSKTQTAMARRVDYNHITGDVVLSGGPPYIEDGESMVKTTSDAAKIVMTGDGKFRVEDPERSRIRIPLGDGEGIDSSIGIGDSLGNFNQ